MNNFRALFPLIPEGEYPIKSFILHCPVCGFDFNHGELVPVRINGGYLGCRDDSGHSGLLVPIHGECGHVWGIGLANHKGHQHLEILTTLDGIDLSVTATTRKGGEMREPIVKFYKSFEKGGDGSFATATSAADADAFLRECSKEMESVLTSRAGDIEFTFNALLPQICDIWAKLRGYKADGVFERRVLVAGEPVPEAHMTCLNTEDNVKETVTA